MTRDRPLFPVSEIRNVIVRPKIVFYCGKTIRKTISEYMGGSRSTPTPDLFIFFLAARIGFTTKNRSFYLFLKKNFTGVLKLLALFMCFKLFEIQNIDLKMSGKSQEDGQRFVVHRLYIESTLTEHGKNQ